MAAPDRHAFTWAPGDLQQLRQRGGAVPNIRTVNEQTGSRLVELFKSTEGKRVQISLQDVDSEIVVKAQTISSDVLWQLTGTTSASMPTLPAGNEDHQASPTIHMSFVEPTKPPGTITTENVVANIVAEDVHKMTLEELAQFLQTDLTRGLSKDEHATRLKANGPNRITPPKQTPWFVKLFMHLTGGFALLMYMCALGSFIMYPLQPQMMNIYVGSILVIVPMATGFFTYYQTIQATALMKRFSGLTAMMCKVIRDGHESEVESAELVTGDVVLLSGGNRIPADLIVVGSVGLKVNNSSLTGEGEPLSRTVGCTHVSMMESKNVMFGGTFVVEGVGHGVVVKTGDDMIIGQVAHCSLHNTKPKSHLKQEMRFFVLIMLGISIGLAVFFLIVAFAVVKYPWETSLLFTIGILVGNMPTGLLPQVTAQLYITAKVMSKLNVMVKNLEVIETLGCVTVIASDKTGTLTQNRMTVSHIVYDGQAKSVGTFAGSEYPKADPTAPGFSQLLDVATLCSFASADEGDTSGNPTEKAIVKYFAEHVDLLAHRTAHRHLADIPFNSNNKWMLTVCTDKSDQVTLYLKGAPERVLLRCRTALWGGSEVPMENHLKQVEEFNNALGGHGERVIGFAFAQLDPKEYPATFAFDMDHPNFPMDQFCFAGLVSLIDPPRPGVQDSIATCQGAGIRIMMVTGDQPVTAEAIARQIGILRPEKPTNPDIVQEDGYRESLVHGDQLPTFTDEDWDRALSSPAVVFARTLPQQKQMIVKRLQMRGEVVSVTGDGVNDSPALKQANCGIAMGIMGSEIAKDAADVILTDDNFSSIIRGIQQGRLVFSNLQNCIVFVLTHVVNEFMPVVVYVCLQLLVAVTTPMMLSMDLGTDLLPAIALAWENPENAIMKQPPRKPTERLTGWRLFFLGYILLGNFECFMGYIIYAFVMAENGFSIGSLFWTAEWWNGPSSSFTPAQQAAADAMMAGNAVYQAQKSQWASAADYRNHAQAMAQTGFTTAVFVAQMGHLFTCRTKYASIFRTRCDNWRLFPAIAFSLGLNLLMVYTPFGSIIFGCAPISPKYYAYSLVLPVAMMTVQEARKFCIRRWPKGVVAFLTDY